MSEEPRYDVALSFAGENRKYVEEVADALRDLGVKVFYDNYEQVELWGKDLYTHLDFVYRKSSRYCVLFISSDYSNKVWTNHERSSAQARALEEHREYVLPARFDDTEIPGLKSTIGYLSLAEIAPSALAEMIQKKLGPRSLSPGFPSKVDRLHKALDYKGPNVKRRKRQARSVALSFYEALGRMTMTERKAVAGAFAFGCVGELPNGIHISLDLLSRMTKMPQAEAMEALTAVASLNVKVRVRSAKDVHPPEDGELRSEDKDLLLSFWSSRAPDARNPSAVVYCAIKEAARHFCPDHGLSVVTSLDFHRLSSSASGPLLVPEETDDPEDSHGSLC